MKKTAIALLSLFFLAFPFITIGVVYLILKINIFDNPEFWYSYMTYFGTVALANVAVWQNRKIKEENDKTQERLEKLTCQSNELTVISKIIENETQNLIRLRTALNEFSYACDPQILSTIYADLSDAVNPTIAISSAMVAAEKHIDDSFFALCRELKTNSKSIKSNKTPFEIDKYWNSLKTIDSWTPFSVISDENEGKSIIFYSRK